MARQIGAITFDIFQGDIQVPAEAVQSLDRLGRDYTRTRTIGIKGRSSTVRTVSFAATTAAGLTLTKTTYPAAKGTIITVVDSLNNSFTNVVVMDVAITGFKEVYTNAGPKTRVSAEWTLMAGDQS